MPAKGDPDVEIDMDAVIAALTVNPDGGPAQTRRLGPTVTDGEAPQIVVPANAWQSATSLGEWTLAGCTVAPGFEFAGFEMALEDWQPG